MFVEYKYCRSPTWRESVRPKINSQRFLIRNDQFKYIVRLVIGNLGRIWNADLIVNFIHVLGPVQDGEDSFYDSLNKSGSSKYRWGSKSSVIRQKGESQNGCCFKKTKHAKFSEKRTFLTPWYAGVYMSE